MKYYNFLISLDMFATGINLNIGKTEKQYNLIGFLFSILTLTLVILSQYTLLRDCLKKINPSIKQLDIQSSSDNKIEFDEESLIIIFHSYKENNNLPLTIDNTIPNQFFKVIVESMNETSVEVIEIANVVKCNEIKLNNGILKENFKLTKYEKDKIKKYAYCLELIDKNKKILIDNQSLIGVILNEISIEKFENLYIEFFIKDYYLDQNDYDNPLKEIWNKEFFILSWGYYVFQKAIKKHVYNFNNLSFLFQSERKEISILKPFQSYLRDINLESNFKSYNMYFRLYSDIMTIKYEIRYITFDDIISGFGGTFSVIFFLVEIFYSSFFSFISKIDLVNSIFKFEKLSNQDFIEFKKSLNKISDKSGNYMNNSCDKYSKIDKEENPNNKQLYKLIYNENSNVLNSFDNNRNQKHKIVEFDDVYSTNFKNNNLKNDEVNVVDEVDNALNLNIKKKNVITSNFKSENDKHNIDKENFEINNIVDKIDNTKGIKFDNKLQENTNFQNEMISSSKDKNSKLSYLDGFKFYFCCCSTNYESKNSKYFELGIKIIEDKLDLINNLKSFIRFQIIEDANLNLLTNNKDYLKSIFIGNDERINIETLLKYDNFNREFYDNESNFSEFKNKLNDIYNSFNPDLDRFKDSFYESLIIKAFEMKHEK